MFKLLAILCGVASITFGVPLLALDSPPQTIYVSSSSGSDRNSGLAADSPVQTLAKARSLMGNGYTMLPVLKIMNVR